MSHDKGRKWLQDYTPGAQLDVENQAWENFPEEEPHWYPNTEGGATSSRDIQRPYLLQG